MKTKMKNLSKEILEYIIPIGDPCNGCGVFVGDYFVTAGHVVDKNKDIIIYFKKKRYILNKENCISLESMNDDSWNSNGSDIAIFKLPSINSPIELYKETLNISDLVTSISYEVKVKECENKDNLLHFIQANVDYLDKVKCEGKVVLKENNFFACEMSYPLRQGSSGSPVFINNKLVGILSAGDAPTETCVFQSINTIVHLLETNDCTQ